MTHLLVRPAGAAVAEGLAATPDVLGRQAPRLVAQEPPAGLAHSLEDHLGVPLHREPGEVAELAHRLEQGPGVGRTDRGEHPALAPEVLAREIADHAEVEER